MCAGKFHDIYHDYKYTYISCGVLLLVASMFLFIGMGINDRLLDKEAKEEAIISKMKVKKEESTTDIQYKDTSNETTVALQAPNDS